MNANRRSFIRKVAAAGLGAGFIPEMTLTGQSGYMVANPDTRAEPNRAQKEWMELDFGMFIHFGINTYYDREWSSGELDPRAYNPVDLDTDQWCRVARNAGMKYVVFNAKHHDGFCNWPTKLTNYSVMTTPFKKDVLGELVNSAIRHGLRMGLYYSLWDEHEPSHKEDEHAYVSFVKGQLEELLKGYGDIVEIWFDGFWKKQQSGWTGPDGSHADPEAFIHAWRMEGAHRWEIDHLYRYIKLLQPGCLVLNNATSRYPGIPLHPVDALCGERATEMKEVRNVWSWLGKPHFFPLQIETTMSTKGNERFPRGNWFWHEWDHSVASTGQILNWLKDAERLGANLLLNCGPMANGKLRPQDVEVLNSLMDIG